MYVSATSIGAVSIKFIHILSISCNIKPAVLLELKIYSLITHYHRKHSMLISALVCFLKDNLVFLSFKGVVKLDAGPDVLQPSFAS